MIKDTVSSTTEIKFADGELVTKIFCDLAWSTSILSTPTPHRAIIFKLFPLSITALSK